MLAARIKHVRQTKAGSAGINVETTAAGIDAELIGRGGISGVKPHEAITGAQINGVFGTGIGDDAVAINIKGVGPRPTGHDGVAAVENVVAIAAIEGVGGLPGGANADQNVIAGATVEGIETATAIQGVIPRIPIQGVVAVPAIEQVVAVPAIEGVIPGSAIQGVSPCATAQGIGARFTIEPVIAVPAIKGVIPGSAIQGIGAAIPIELVIAITAI